MNATAVESKPIWLEEPRPRFSSLKQDAHFDVVIIGGGITGMTAAWMLKQAGKTVALFEKGRIGDAETGHTTAHLTYVTDERLSRLVKNFGEETAQLVWQAGDLAIDTIEAIIHQYQLDCHFKRVPGFLHAALTKERDETSELVKEADLARKLGFEAAFLASVPLVDRPGIRFANQACFHPIEYLSELARRIHGDGCEIHENSEISDFEEDPLAVLVNGCTVRCDRLVVATHVPMMGLTSLPSATFLQTKIAGYSTYAIGAKVPAGSLPHASFWDTDDPYYYLRIAPATGKDYAILGGLDHKTGQHDNPEALYAELETVVRRLVPQAEVDHRWSGQVIEPVDGLPFIGPTNESQFVATGFSGNGMTFGTLAGVMACDWIIGRENRWKDVFDVHRTKVRGGALEYVKENVDYPLHLVTGFVRSPDAKSVDEVERGEGRIVKIDGKRCAVHRSAEGKLTACSAICTHMGCVVRWNGAEETWDCPCHGSRFGTDGHVIAGPAEKELEPVALA